MRRTIVLAIACAALAVVSPGEAGAHSDFLTRVTGFGLSGDYGYRHEVTQFHDGGLYASFKYGVFGFMSAFFCADAGYRFHSGEMVVRAGGEGYFGPAGLRVDVFQTFPVRERKKVPVPGLAAGFTAVLPSNPSPSIFLGGQFFNNKRPEVVVRLGIVFNIRRKPGFNM
jgi:hypothetical protein